MNRLFACALAAAVLTAPTILAQPVGGAQLADVETQLKRRFEEERRLKDEAERRAREVDALRKRMVETATAVQGAERRIAAITEELQRLDEEEAKIGTSLLIERNNLGDVLAALQRLEISRPPALLVTPDDANRAARAAMLLSAAAPEIELRAKALRAKLDRLAQIRKDRDRERADFEKTNVEIGQRRSVLAELLAKKQKERDVAAGLAAAAQRETAALAARATDIRGVIDRLDRFATAIVPRLKPPAPRPEQIASSRPTPAASRVVPTTREAFSPGLPFPRIKGAMAAPVVGALTGRFGAPKPEGGAFEGVRFEVRDQAIVTAPHDASVAFAQSWGPIGNVVILDVGSGYKLLLIGVTNLLVQEGQTVAAGEPVGSIAAARPGGEAILDFEIRRNSEPVNPSLWLKRAPSG